MNGIGHSCQKTFLLVFLFSYLLPSLYAADTDIVINEVMLNPAGDSNSIPGDKSNEFIELFNKGNEPIDLAGWSISDNDSSGLDKIEGWNVSIASHGPLSNPNVSNSAGNSVLQPGGFAVILDQFYNDPANDQPYNFPAGTIILRTTDGRITNASSNGGLSTTDPLTLFNTVCSSISTFGTPVAPTSGICSIVADFDDNFPTDPGEDNSWERVNPSLPDSPSNWKKSTVSKGTPGAKNSVFNTPCIAKSLFGQPLITEVAPSLPSSLGGDFVEIFVSESHHFCGVTLFEGKTLIKTFPSVTAKSAPFGSSIIFHAGTKVSVKDPDETDETGDLNMNGMIDLYSDESSPAIVGGSSNNLTLKSSDGKILDFITWTTPTSSDYDSTLQSSYDGAVTLTGVWTPACVSSDLNCYLTTSVSWTNSNSQSMARKVGKDGNPQNSKPSNKGDWFIGTPTPGRGYSDRIQPKGEIVEIFQSPFSPYGDGRFTEAVISYKVPMDSVVNIEIYDSQGKVVRTLLDRVISKSADSQTVTWSGRDSHAQIVPVGIYIVHIEAQKPDRGVERESKTIVVGRRL